MSHSPKRNENTIEHTAEIEREYFDRYVAEHDDFNPFMKRGWQTIERRFVEYAKPHRSARLLDIGCGTGQSRQIYIEHVGHYTGIDLSPAAIETARAAFPQDSWQAADACQLPFADESFDVVAFSSVLHHIPDFGLALNEGLRVLKPHGVCFAFDPNLLHPAIGLFRCPKSPLYSSRGVSPNERPLLPGHLRREFQTAGFESLQQRCQSDIPYRSVAPRLLNAALSLYNFADWAWERVGLGAYFGTFVITVGKKPARRSARRAA